MLNCLMDYVGIRGCVGSSPRSGVYINSMAGVTKEMLEHLTKQESNTFKKVWEDIQTRTIRRFSLAVRIRFRKKFKIKTIAKSVDLEKDIDVASVTTASANYRGIYIDSNYFADQLSIKRSALQSHYIQALQFYSPIAQSGTVIKVFDKLTDAVIDTFTFNAAIGWNNIYVDKEYSERVIFIGVDSTNINSVKKELPGNTQNSPTNIRGGSLAIGASMANIDLSTNTFGLTGQFGLRCSYDPAICNNLDVFTMPFAYLLVSEIMFERIASTRVNSSTLDIKQAEQVKAWYDMEFEKALGEVVDNIDLDQNDSCVECNAMLTVKENDSFFSNYLDHHG